MRLRELIAEVDAIRPGNAFTEATKTTWVNEVEGKVITDIWMLSPADVVEYHWDTDEEAELVVPKPYYKLYRYWLMAMMDMANGEWRNYADSHALFNEAWAEYAGWYGYNVNPAVGDAEREGYYLSAYALAVKYGYRGSEEEWLSTLKGDKGDVGDPVVVRDMYGTLDELNAAVPAPQVGWMYAIGTTNDNTVYGWNGTDWVNYGPLGKGDKGDPGESVTVESVTESDADGGENVVKFSDGKQLTVKNGRQGKPGSNGANGLSPTFAVTDITGGHRLTITDANGTKIFDVMDGSDGYTPVKGKDYSDGADGVGIQSIERTSGNGAAGTTDTYTITLTNGQTATFTVTNGKDGEGAGDMTAVIYDPTGKKKDIFGYVDDKLKDIDVDVTADEVTFSDGETFQRKYDAGELKGSPGYTPQKGVDYFDGEDGVSVTRVEQITTSTEDGGTNVIRVTLSNGAAADFEVKNGSKGNPGDPGDSGPNEVSSATATNITGLLKGNGSTVQKAVPGTDYEAPGAASTAVSTHNAASAAHSTLFAAKMPLKTSGVTLTASTTLALTHAEKMLLVNSASAVTITIPTHASVALPVGTLINIAGIGTGTVTLSPASGVTLYSKESARSIDGQYGAVTLYKASDNVWYCWGALA